MAQSFREYVTKNLTSMVARLQRMERDHAAIAAQQQLIEKLCDRPPNILEEVESIPGRRIYYNLVAQTTFTIAQNGRRGQPAQALVSQDGPFIQTHYPFALWRPSAPATATNFGLWRPVSAYPLPDQATPASGNFDLDEDIISISYEVTDAGSQRNFQNAAAPPILSTPDNLVPLPVPTLFTPNSTVQFFPTYESIRFSNGVVPPTDGVLVVAFPGYRIANM